jgi:threonine dehydratase
VNRTDAESTTAQDLVTLAELLDAWERIEDTCIWTPVLQLTHPERGYRVAVKAESLQRTGSFKLRGATNAVAAHLEKSAVGVVTYSAGNHGRSLAYAAQQAGLVATVVMPDATPEVQIAATRALGARVVLRPADEIVAHAHELAEMQGQHLVPPFDDALVIAGQGTVGLELLDQVEQLDVVLIPVGGGGLVAGVAAAIKSQRPDTQIVAVEPALAADLAEGVGLGCRRVWPRALTRRTIADGLRSAAVGELPWAHITALVDEVVTVTDDSIVAAMKWLAAEGKLMVEPSGAVAAAALLEHADHFSGSVVVIASGGNIDPATFASFVA